MPKQRRRLGFAQVAAVVSLALLISGCAGHSRPAPMIPASDKSTGGWVTAAPATPTAQSTAPATVPTPAPAAGTAASSVSHDARIAPRPPQQLIAPRAGMVDDNADFGEYLRYMEAYRGPKVHRVDVAGRRFVQVLDGQNRPVLDAAVTVTPVDGNLASRVPMTGRTLADGRVPFYPTGDAARFRIRVERGGFAHEQTLPMVPGDTAIMVLERLNTAQDPLRLDLLFLIDATGSMGDEISQLKRSIDTIAARIDALGQPKPLTRYGMVIYRDRGDEFITRTFDFTDDVRRFAAGLAQVEAAGGGDKPESLNEALHEALHRPSWRLDAHTIRLVFLVADAPPHLDYPNDYDYAKLMPVAVQRGIKISAIAASGLDDQGEYIFRQLAQYTQGRFVFLTYANGVSGTPGDKTTHHVEQFRVENLDDLVVRLVHDEVRLQIKAN